MKDKIKANNQIHQDCGALNILLTNALTVCVCVFTPTSKTNCVGVDNVDE